MSSAESIAHQLQQIVRSVRAGRCPSILLSSQWLALRILAESNPRVQTITALAQRLGVVHSAASPAIKALARKQLVTMGPGHDEHRQLEFDLTTKGRALLAHDPIAHLMQRLMIRR